VASRRTTGRGSPPAAPAERPLIETDPALAIDLVEHCGDLVLSSDPPTAGYGLDGDELCEAMAQHASHCERCRTDWVVQLFRVKRAGDEDL
jgi:hypothetical protein